MVATLSTSFACSHQLCLTSPCLRNDALQESTQPAAGSVPFQLNLHLCLQPSIAFEQQVGQQAICSLQFSQQVVPLPTDTKPSSRRSPPGKAAMADEPLHTRSEKASYNLNDLNLLSYCIVLNYAILCCIMLYYII